MSRCVFRFEDESIKNKFLYVISYHADILEYKGDVVGTNFIAINPELTSIIAIPVDYIGELSSTLVTADLLASMQIIQDRNVLIALLFSWHPSGVDVLLFYIT